MDTWVEWVISWIAERENVTVEEVCEDIAHVISTARANPDPEIQARWLNIPCQGDEPTPEEIINYFVALVGGK